VFLIGRAKPGTKAREQEQFEKSEPIMFAE